MGLPVLQLDAGGCAVSRARTGDTLLAALALVSVTWPILTLFAPADWVRPMLVMVGVVALSGMAGRLLFSRGASVGAFQVGATVLGASWMFGRGHLWHGLPGVDTVLAFNNLLYQARLTIQSFSAPAPTNRGVIVGIALVVALFAIAVDYLAVTRRSPALAGLPLLTAYLISAANTGEALSLRYFVLPAVLWLVMVGRQGVGLLRRWGTSTPLMSSGRSGDADGTLAFASTGRLLGAAGVVLAVIMPMVLPHMPTHFLAEGLGQSEQGTGFSGDAFRLDSTLDIKDNLASRSERPVLKYTTSDAIPQPLRVEVVTNFADGEWRTRRMRTELSSHPRIPEPAGYVVGSARQERIRVADNRVRPPQLAAPYPIRSADVDGAPWGVNSNLSPRIGTKVDSYEVTYLHQNPAAAVLNQPLAAPASEVEFREELEVDPASAKVVDDLVKSLVPAGASRIEAARRIQAYLRGTDFSYSLTLADRVSEVGGRPVGQDPISQFLATKQGYCVQFATAMVMMARSLGIPARMAIGFLPGSVDRGTYTVREADAHAWPELYFEGAGWLAFEATPAARAPVVPAYSQRQTETITTTAPTLGTGATSAPTRTGPEGRNDPGATTDVQGTTTGNPFTQALVALKSLPWTTWLLITLVLAVLGGLSVPAAARARHRRALMEAADSAERVEVEWQSMVRRIADLGVSPPVGSTPRQAGQYLRHEGYLTGEDAEALGRVVATLERSRYAPPGDPLPDIGPDSRAVVQAVSTSRRRKDRLRATWLPQDGVVQWRDGWYAVSSAPARGVAWVRARLVRRH